MNRQKDFDGYVERMTEIRRLSTPSMDGIKDADAYSDRLRMNFVRIGQLAAQNRSLLENELYPLLQSEEALTETQIADISSFHQELINAVEVETLDLPVTSLITSRLLKDAANKGELSWQIRQMDKQIEVCYALMNMTERVYLYPEISAYYRRMGEEIGRFFISMRQHERFAEIENAECRCMVLTNARYAAAFFENLQGDDRANQRNLNMLDKSLEILQDAFYKPLVPDYDWNYYHYRALDYYAMVTNYCNVRGFNKNELLKICARTEELWALWHSDPGYFGEINRESYVRLLLIRNRYLAGKLSIENYLQELLKLYQIRDRQSYDLSGVTENLMIPTEILCLLKPELLTQEESLLLEGLYHDVLAYAFQMPNSGILSFMLEYLSYFLERFIDIPDGMNFEDMMLNCLAAIHPPTYVHSQMVAQFTKCLCKHLLDYRPDLFVGVLGCNCEEEVHKKRNIIIDFAYHGALCHDAGKVFIIDTVFVYGRKLFDMEFDIIKTHPKMGAEILLRHKSTAQYAEVALGHHKWYDNTKGYPSEFDTTKSSLKTIIDLVLCADCLDAATDTVGRSYKKGKTFSDFIGELKEGSGTQYAPWLIELFSRDKVIRDIEYLMTEGRSQNYQGTYQLLREMQEQVR